MFELWKIIIKRTTIWI